MIKFQHILKLSKPYSGRRAQYVVYNLLTALFNVFSIGMLVPFLKVIFKENVELTKQVTFSWNPSQLIDYLDYQLSAWIVEWGPFNALIYFSIGIVIMFFLKNIFLFLAFYNLAYIRSGVVRDIRQDLYDHLLSLPLSYFNKEKRGDIISKLTNDIKEVEWSLLGVLEMLFKHPFAIVIPILALFITSYKLTLFVIIVLPVSGFIISRLGKKLKDAAQLGQEKLGEVISQIEESLHGVKIIKAFNATKDKKSSFRGLNDQHFGLMVKLHRREFLASPLSEFMGSIVISVILIYSGNLILNQESALTGSFLIAYIAMFSQLIPPAKAITEAFFRIKKGSASLDRLNEILVHPPEIDSGGLQNVNFEKDLSFENVSFSYGDTQVLNQINLSVNKGQTIALVGPSGGGKSTLVDLIPRFLQLKDGHIRIDGTDISDISLQALRSSIGVVTQEAVLFNDTVANNIKMGDYYCSGDQIIEAAKVANAHEFIQELEDGYNTNIGEKGMNLSGGQRQRLSIARAILKNPPILILDEATSALDTESEKYVQEALEKVMQGRTSLVIAHRLSTIQNADLIVVIDQGKIAEQGTHDELMSTGGIYQKLVALQTFD
ncbi:MAG: ABC transporter ATP-binding protein [Bacteroidia bacterium]